ncbi:MAG TPA: M50 family metallopeptidase [Kofleriaceae bacterium]
MRAELRTLALALIASLLLWNLPFGGLVLYPFKILATWLHEMSHGVVMIATGAELDRVVIYRDTSGLSYAVYAVSEPGTAAIAAAGYMGTALWGAVLLVATPTAKTARWALIAIAVLMMVTVVFAIVPTPEEGRFGQWAIAAIAIALAVCGLVLPSRWRVFGAHFIAAQACINALLDIRVLLRPMQAVNGMLTGTSDATAMADNTFGTRHPWAVWFWAIVWLAWSLAVLFVALRVSGWRAARSAQPAAPPTA